MQSSQQPGAQSSQSAPSTLPWMQLQSGGGNAGEPGMFQQHHHAFFHQQQHEHQPHPGMQPLAASGDSNTLSGGPQVITLASGAPPAAWAAAAGPPVYAQAPMFFAPAGNTSSPPQAGGSGPSSGGGSPSGSNTNSHQHQHQHQHQHHLQQHHQHIQHHQHQQQGDALIPVLLPNGQQAFVSASQLQHFGGGGHLPMQTMHQQQTTPDGTPVVWGAAPVQFVAGGATPTGSAQSSMSTMVYPTLQDSPGNSANSSSRHYHHHQQMMMGGRAPAAGNNNNNSGGGAAGGSSSATQRTRTPPPAPGEDERGPRQLIVNYLPPTVTDRDLRQIFGQVGPVEVARISRDSSGASKAFGFVYFRSSDDARRAIDALNGYTWLNKRIKVEWATQRGPHPPGTSRYRPPSVPDGYIPRPAGTGGSSTGGVIGIGSANCSLSGMAPPPTGMAMHAFQEPIGKEVHGGPSADATGAADGSAAAALSS